MRLFLLVLLATAQLARADARALPASGLNLDLGALSSGYNHVGGTSWEPFAAQALSGHVLLGGFTLDAGLLSLVPLQRDGASGSLTLTLRAGYTGERWSLVGGPVLNWGYTAQPALQVLPSLRALVHVGPVDLHAGLLDLHGLVPAHLGASYRGVGLAYVVPLGARAWVHLPLSAHLGLRVEGFAFRLGTARSAWLTVGLSASPSPGAS